MENSNAPIYKYQPLFGSWKVEEEIGEGSFGTVYLVSKEELGQKYLSAVKLITIPSKEQFREAKSSLGTDESTLHAYFQDVVENIIKEVNILHSLSGNNHILNYHDHSVRQREDKIGWDILIRMEYVTSLPKYLETHTLAREQIIRVGTDICSALELCTKKGIVHRDIKDENIFVNSEEVFKLGDFGIARELSGSGRAASMRGTPLYMAPEVYRGEKYDATVDIYSLGIVLYKLLNNGRMPFMPPFPEVIKYKDGESALERRMSGEAFPLPVNGGEALGRVVLKACAFRQEDRYVSAEEMRKALEQAQKDMSRDGREQVSVTLTAPAMQSHGNRENKIEGTVSIFAQLKETAPQEKIVQEKPKPINIKTSTLGEIGYKSNPDEVAPTENNFYMAKETTPLPSTPKETRAEQTVDNIQPKIIDPSDTVNVFNVETSKSEPRSPSRIWIGILILLILVLVVILVGVISGKFDGNNGSVETKPTNTPSIVTTSTAPTTALSIVNTSTDTGITSISTAAETEVTSFVNNTEGNTAGNIENSGIVAQQGDWIYYSNRSNGGYLYKIRTDDSEKTQLNSEESRNINVVGDWIYYTNINACICKIRTDGTERTILNGMACGCLNVIGDWIYYAAPYIYKMKTDGTEETQLTNDKSQNISVVGDWIYYTIFTDNYSDGQYLCKIRTDGTERAQLNSDNSWLIAVVNDWVYYSNNSDNGYLYKMQPDGSERILLNNDYSWSLNVVGDWVYYSNNNDGGYLYKIRTDGTEKVQLNSDNVWMLNIIGDWIYYRNKSDDDFLYKIRTDGTDRQKVE
jgi:serine/threonine protein kinase